MQLVRVTSTTDIVAYVNLDKVLYITFDDSAVFPHRKAAHITTQRGTIEIPVSEYNEKVAPLIGGQHED